jgi:cytochrome c peroxidase
LAIGEEIMNKFILVLLAVIPLLSGCDNSPRTTIPRPSPQITACPSDSAEEKDYSPMDQMALLANVKAGNNQEAFMEAFEQGDVIFATNFTLEQGGGAYIGGSEKSHYTRIPRADLKKPGEWGDPNRQVKRPTGPNAQSCVSCHNQPNEDGAGPTAVNVHRDHRFTGNPELMIQRNTPHLFGAGALQRLAEEMSEELYEVKDKAGKKACSSKSSVQQDLTAKGVYFGYITMTCENGTATIDAGNSKLEGVNADWIIRPYEWKKNVTFLRDFMRHAGHNEIGMQGVELVGKDVDEDNDGKSNELSVGDMTAFTVYMAAQPRPTTRVELDDLGILTGDQRLKTSEREQIKRGDQLFQQIGCSSCHKPELTLTSSVFQEPSEYVAYRDKKTDFNQKDKVQVDLEAEGLLPAHPVRFDLAHDLPQNQLCKGKEKINLGAFEYKNGKTIVRLYGDLKRHWMGDELSEPIDEEEATEEFSGGPNMSLNVYNPVDAVIGPESYATQPNRGKSTFGTKELWGVACTGPWLHDGRATTLSEAILLHGGEAASSRDRFKGLPAKDQKDVIAFLGNQVLYLNTADPGKTPDGLSSDCEVKN